MNTKPVGRVGRSPVISVRVRAPLHKRIIKTAKASGRSMSEEMAVLLERGLELTDRLGNRSMAIWARPMKIAVAKLEINAGDTVILRAEQMLTPTQSKELQVRAEQFMPDDVKVMVLSPSLSLSVMKKAS
jgi:hypothetical protein